MALRTIKPFEYFQPSTLEELLPLVEKFGSEGKIMAGGTDLVVQLKTREVPPLKYVFDIENIEGLHYIRDEGETLRIGPTVKLRTLKTSPLIRKKTFILAEAVRSLATPQIRTMGTIGGNLCNASPGADTAPPLLSLGARVKILSTKGERIVPIENFFASVKRTALRSSELLTEIIVPCQPDGYGGAFMKVGRRVGHDISVANVAVVVKLTKDCVEDVRIALGSVAPTPMRAIETEAFLKGKEYSQENITRAAEIASTEIKPISDIRASAEYRREVVKSLIEMAIQRAAERIRRR
jgi:CO/xanthine dehydrogenase FAD-binding subunit